MDHSSDKRPKVGWRKLATVAFRTHRRGLGRGLAVLATGALAGGALAQGIIAPPSAGFERPASSYALSTNQMGGIPPEVPSGGVPQGPVQFGPVDVHPHLLYRFVYGDGIPATPSTQEKTAIQELTPGVLLLLGNYWTLDYTPTLRFYSNKHFPDSTDELVTLAGATHYEDWTLQLSQTYSASTSPLEETGQLTQQANYVTMLSFARQLGEKASADLKLNQSFRATGQGLGGQDIHEWTADMGMNYQFWARFGAGADVLLGYDGITPGASARFEDLSGHASWKLGEKLTLSGSAGAEARQLLGKQLINPIFSASLVYKPWEPTTFDVEGSRTVTPSFFENQVLVNTTIGATISQRFFQKLTLQVAGGYTTSPFVGFSTFPVDGVFGTGTPPPVGVERVSRDDYSRYVRVTLSAPFLKRGTASVFYSNMKNTSGIATYAFSTVQFGFELGYRY